MNEENCCEEVLVVEEVGISQPIVSALMFASIVNALVEGVNEKLAEDRGMDRIIEMCNTPCYKYVVEE